MSNEQGDSDDLEALFDSIVMANQSSESAVTAKQKPATPAPVDAIARSSGSEDRHGDDKMFASIGHMTRNLHDTLRELGYDKNIEQAVDTIPDTRERLNYIAAMTEKAAERSLAATEIAQPLQEKMEAGANRLKSKWDRMLANELSVEEFKQLVGETRSYLGEVPEHTKATNAQLMEIMMAQDFQDLTGQVIKKITELAQKMETQLLQLLLESTPSEKRTEVTQVFDGLLNGPVINSAGGAEVVTNQQQVDDLLESLGF
ncbi:MAG: protein phosphatase CheZ [Sulfuricellaceae bacterium]|nr:protein phosphatase CheZ [Sulfuricellaceae bacterium]